MGPGGERGDSIGSGGKVGGDIDWNSDLENFETQLRRNKKGKRRVGFLDSLISRANKGFPAHNEESDESSDSGERQNGVIGVKNQSGGGNTATGGHNAGNSGNTVRKDQSGLNPNRIRGFGDQSTSLSKDPPNAQAPTLNDMRARQGAIVAKFMTFFRRKSTLVIEMYEACFYREKPKWDQIADFIYRDLCPTDTLRRAVKDVQLHPVKMLIFVRFAEDRFRDEVVARIRSEGVNWSEYKVRVKGYSLDAQVKFIRLLGISPETEAPEIKRAFQEAGIGEVIECRKGFLDSNRLPGVTNGTWSLRVKITNPEKAIPSYIHRRDEGELWSLNFEGRVFCCWKCGSPSHIGDKCRDQSKTFEEIFHTGDELNDDGSERGIKPTWAAVVRSGNGESEVQRKRVRDVEVKVRAENQRKAQIQKEKEEQKRQQIKEIADREAREVKQRQDALKEAESTARAVVEATLADGNSVVNVSDTELPRTVEGNYGIKSLENMRQLAPTIELDSVVDAEIRSQNVALKTTLSSLSTQGMSLDKLPPELDLLYGSRANLLAICYEPSDILANMSDKDEMGKVLEEEVSTPVSRTAELQQPTFKSRKRLKHSRNVKEHSIVAPQVIADQTLRCHNYASSNDSSEDLDLKKVKLEEEESLWREAFAIADDSPSPSELNVVNLSSSHRSTTASTENVHDEAISKPSHASGCVKKQ